MEITKNRNPRNNLIDHDNEENMLWEDIYEIILRTKLYSETNAKK